MLPRIKPAGDCPFTSLLKIISESVFSLFFLTQSMGPVCALGKARRQVRRCGFPIQGSLSSWGGQNTSKKTDRRETATDGGGYR